MSVTTMLADKAYKINIIEDDGSMRMMLQDFILEKYPSAEVTCYSTGEEALEKISLTPDMIILDYNLDSVSGGVMNGIQVLNKIKEKYPKVPVVFLSGQESSDVAANTMKHGAEDYIIKNENVFKRLEIAMRNILASIDHEKPASRFTLIAWIVIAVLLILGVIALRSMK